MTTRSYRLTVLLPQQVLVFTTIHVDGRSGRDCDRHAHQMIGDLYPDALSTELTPAVPAPPSAYVQQAIATSSLADIYDDEPDDRRVSQ